MFRRPRKIFHVKKDNIKAGLYESDRFIKIPVNLSTVQFIPKSTKILLLEHSQSNTKTESYIYIANKNFIVKKAIYFTMKLDFIGTIVDSNFIFFYFNDSIFLMNLRSKLFPSPLYMFKPKDVEKLISINLKEITLENENKILKLSFNNLSMNTLKKLEKVPKAQIAGSKFLILPGEESQKVLCYHKENNLIKITDSLNNKLVFTLLIEDEEVIFCNDFLKEGKLYLLILTPILVSLY